MTMHVSTRASQLRKALRLYLVTARYGESEQEFLKKIEEACQAGVSLVQLREKEATTAMFYRLGQAVKAITDRYGIPLIINDRLDICLAVDAAGLHIGDQDLPLAQVRRLLGPDKWIGVSAKTLERAVEAEQGGADYLGVGAIFPTQTKVLTQATSLETLQAISQGVSLPVVAIGGIEEGRIGSFQYTGIAGVAVVSRIMQAAVISETVALFQKELDKIIGGQER